MDSESSNSDGDGERASNATAGGRRVKHTVEFEWGDGPQLSTLVVETVAEMDDSEHKVYTEHSAYDLTPMVSRVHDQQRHVGNRSREGRALAKAIPAEDSRKLAGVI